MEKIQRGALGRKDGGRRPLDPEHERALFHPGAVTGEKFCLQRRINAGEDAGGDRESAKHEILLGVDDRTAAVLFRKNGAARDVAKTGVLLQGEVDQVFSARSEHEMLVV